jgi:hypothetical protein
MVANHSVFCKQKMNSTLLMKFVNDILKVFICLGTPRPRIQRRSY